MEAQPYTVARNNLSPIRLRWSLDRLNKKLLILGCAGRKRDSDGLLPALDRYDGPSYRVVRKFLREYRWPEDVSIAVLSAEHGLLSAEHCSVS